MIILHNSRENLIRDAILLETALNCLNQLGAPVLNEGGVILQAKHILQKAIFKAESLVMRLDESSKHL